MLNKFLISEYRHCETNFYLRLHVIKQPYEKYKNISIKHPKPSR